MFTHTHTHTSESVYVCSFKFENKFKKNPKTKMQTLILHVFTLQIVKMLHVWWLKIP